jgi:Fur family ferric uptake transcriptional regulator
MVREQAEVHRAVGARLADNGQLYTPNRRSIVEALSTAGAPITLPALLEAESSLASSSAYRSLAVLTDAGIVRRLVHGGDHAHFELAEHLTSHHHHLICEVCGAVADVTLPRRVESAMDRTFDEVAAATGFSPTHHAVDIYGTCESCQLAAS